MKCSVSYCRFDIDGTRFCTLHRISWVTSPEYRRFRTAPVRMETHFKTAITDFVRRIDAEKRNGGQADSWEIFTTQHTEGTDGRG